jgi:platelet-activating factor acetylhydrolase IB subunit alpha
MVGMPDSWRRNGQVLFDYKRRCTCFSLKKSGPFTDCELRMKIMDLENRNASLQEELSMAPAKRAASQTDWIPRAPAAHVLTGHRSPVTRVAFHPQYSILASASEDATVKIWDWETGEFERTLKGHTKAVMDVDFDHKGNLLGN